MKKKVTIWTDGGARGNPGPAGIGAVLRDESFTVVGEVSEFIGTATNNQAEYQALIAGLEQARELGAEAIEVRCDSELVVKQVEGEYRVKNEGIKPLHTRVRGLLSEFDQYTILHVRREKNKEADALVNQAIDAAVL